jgi:hypothetical protein
MTLNTHQPLRFLCDALRGVGASFGGARRVEFLPALPGGHAFADLQEPSTEVLDAVESAATCATLNADTTVMAWSIPESEGCFGMLTLSQLKDVKYEGSGIWGLRSKQRIRLLEDRHVMPTASKPDPLALLGALKGNADQNSVAHSIVTINAKNQFEEICEIVTFIMPAFELAANEPEHEDVRTYLAGSKAGTPILSCRSTMTDEFLHFDLPTLLGVRHQGEGVFRLPNGQRFGALALRPVAPEHVSHAKHGFMLPRMDFRPPATDLH